MYPEFRTDPAAFRREASRRLWQRVLLAAAVLGGGWLLAFKWFSLETLRWAASYVVMALVVFTLVAAQVARRSRRLAPAMRLRLTDEALECYLGADMYPLAYGELRLHRVVSHAGQVVRIELRTGKRAVVRLAGFERMTELAEALTARLAGARSAGNT